MDQTRDQTMEDELASNVRMFAAEKAAKKASHTRMMVFATEQHQKTLADLENAEAYTASEIRKKWSDTKTTPVVATRQQSSGSAYSTELASLQKQLDVMRRNLSNSIE